MRRAVRIGGDGYAIELSRFREVFGGAERVAVIDHAGRRIILSSTIRLIVASAVSQARATRPEVPLPALADRPLVPHRLSGCFPVLLIPWPWWPEAACPR